MARLDKTPFPGFDERFDVKDIDGSIRKQKEALAEIEKKYQVVKFPVADGYALYAVLKEKPLTLRHIPFMDGYEAAPATIRGLRIADVRRQKRADDLWKERDKEHEDFYASLTPGQTVHYSNGFNEFVRCEVVVEDGKNVLKPVALVGEWREYDLPRRLPDGSLREGYHAERIRTGETWRANASCIWESPVCANKGRMKDPTGLDPIDLTVPDMDDEEQAQARLWRKVDRVREITSCADRRDADPIKVLAHVIEVINAA